MDAVRVAEVVNQLGLQVRGPIGRPLLQARKYGVSPGPGGGIPAILALIWWYPGPSPGRGGI